MSLEKQGKQENSCTGYKVIRTPITTSFLLTDALLGVY